MSKRIAVTGGIGSGKSSVMDALRDMGYPVFSCDEIYADMVNSADYLNELSKIFPKAVKDNRLDKKQLSQIVFNNPEALQRLNAISHPMIMQKLNERMNACSAPLVFAEVPLLFENGFEKDFDSVIVVLRDINNRITAVCNRDGLTKEQTISRINAQFDYDCLDNQKYLQSINAHIIQNDGEKSALIQKVSDIVKSL